MCLGLCAAEHDAVYAWIIVHNALKGKILVLGIDHIIYVVNVLGTLVARTNYNLLIIVQVALGNLLNLLAHCGREEQRVTVGRNRLEYFINAVRESHVKHLICLVQHNVLYIVKLGSAAMQKVNKASRSGHDNLRTVLKCMNLVDD